MARRCSSCNKFCPVVLNDYVDVDLSLDVEGPDGATVGLSGELELTSECCSDTVATASPQDEVEIDVQHNDGCLVPEQKEDPEYEIEDGSSFSEDNRYEGSGRWMKTFYGVSGEVTIKCGKCDAEATHDARLEEQASGFDEY